VICERCDLPRPTVAVRARLRRTHGRRPAWSVPTRLCADCTATVARLLGEGNVLVPEPVP
jgi:hypothetical protein